MKRIINQKEINIPDKRINDYMKMFNVDKEDAIQIFLEEEGHIINTEQQELNTKAIESGVIRTIHGAKNIDKPATPRPHTVKISTEKEGLFVALSLAAAEYAESVGGTSTIAIDNKLVYIEINEKKFKLDLVEQRPAKKPPVKK